MDLLMILFVIAIIGCGAWLIQTYIPMPPVFKMAINVLAVIFILLYLFKTFGSAIPNVL